MKLIGEQTKLRFAVLPIGDFFTMGIADALRAADLVGVTEDRGRALRHLSADQARTRRGLEGGARRGKELLLPKIGETIEL